jgi:hypothetical protein
LWDVIPAFSRPDIRQRSARHWMARATEEVQLKIIKQLPKVEPLPQQMVDGAGFYYGLSSVTIKRQSKKSERVSTVRESMSQTLDEIKAMRQEMEMLRKELESLRKQMSGAEEHDMAVASPEETSSMRRKKQREYDRLGSEIETWAERLLFEENDESNGWSNVECGKMFRKTLNADDRTKCYVKWMKDSRPGVSDSHEYPILKAYSTIDAPLEEVCYFLSRVEYMTTYNDLVVKHKDLEEISSHSKIVWGQTPQILFLKPRDLITFCHHRWLKDGTQVLVHQACDNHDQAPYCKNRAFALRGANYISRDPEDPTKTRIAILTHGSPGSDVPSWACKTAVNALAPIEPYKLFHKINEGVKRTRLELRSRVDQLGDMDVQNGRTSRPAGIAQLGYACFWPDGGGLVEEPAVTLPVDGATEVPELQNGKDDGPVFDIDPATAPGRMYAEYDDSQSYKTFGVPIATAQ